MTRYELMERLAVGAVAEIFRGKAVAAGGFEKPVAIKRILPHLSQDRRFVEALMAEAKILSQLRHRNIVQIFDVGLGDDGQYFLVMEFVDGIDLGDIQGALEGRRKRLPLDLVLHVAAEVCEALEHAHTALAPDGKPMRLVHRDVAPSNVLVSRHGEVKLTDFGLARRPEEITHGGMRGKFGYLSPEAAAGLPIDPRSDVFSAAVIVYELALGRRLFSHLTDLEAVRAVYECNVPRPRDVDPTLPAELDEILCAALVKDPARRLPSAAQLGARLRSLRYSLELAEGDPAQELARVVGGVEAAGSDAGAEPPSDARRAAGRRRKPISSGYPGEPTVVSLTSLDVFKDDRDGTGLIKARAVLDRFEEEETRLASQPGIAFGGGRWREPQDSLDALALSSRRETGPTGVFADGRPSSAADDESTRVVNPMHLARRAATDSDVGPRPRLGAASPPPLPGMSRTKPSSMPPPVPKGTPAAIEAAVRIEAQVPLRPATPTVDEHPSATPIPRPSPAPVVAGFDRRPGRPWWLYAVAVVVMILAAGITAALLR